MPSLRVLLHKTAKTKNKQHKKKLKFSRCISVQVFQHKTKTEKISTVIHKNLLIMFCAFEGLFGFIFLTSLLVYTVRTIILIAY